jgi:hypothetical protein
MNVGASVEKRDEEWTELEHLIADLCCLLGNEVSVKEGKQGMLIQTDGVAISINKSDWSINYHSENASIKVVGGRAELEKGPLRIKGDFHYSDRPARILVLVMGLMAAHELESEIAFFKRFFTNVAEYEHGLDK